MTTLDSRCLDAFPGWLRSLAEDAQQLAALLDGADASAIAQRGAASALSYLFKSLDLIPDGLEDLGFIDDAFVLRVAAAQALADDESLTQRDELSILRRLASESELVREFLAADFPRLEKYVRNLTEGSARGRSVAQILEDAAVRAEFVHEVKQWATGYAAPTFARDARSLVKLKSFLAARLPK